MKYFITTLICLFVLQIKSQNVRPCKSCAKYIEVSGIIPPSIKDKGYDLCVRFYCDINNDSIMDYGRIVGGTDLNDQSEIFLSFDLGKKDGGWILHGYKSPKGADLGFLDCRQKPILQDVNNDGYLDYCREVGTRPNSYYSAMLGTKTGFNSVMHYLYSYNVSTKNIEDANNNKTTSNNSSNSEDKRIKYVCLHSEMNKDKTNNTDVITITDKNIRIYESYIKNTGKFNNISFEGSNGTYQFGLGNHSIPPGVYKVTLTGTNFDVPDIKVVSAQVTYTSTNLDFCIEYK